jgi:hypothetical protein
MARKDKSEDNAGKAKKSEEEIVTDKKKTMDFNNNIMGLMKEWYDQSSKMLNFMLTSFSGPGFGNPGISGDNPEEGGDSKSTIWNGYLENIEKVMKEIASVYRYDPERMEALNKNWRDFQESVSEYFKIDGITESAPGLPPDVWTKWFEYANTMNKRVFECFYDADAQPGMSQAFSSMAGSVIKTGVPCDNVSQLDEASLNEMNEIIGRYYAEMTKELMAANEAVVFKNESAVDKSQEFMEKWTGSYDKFMKELIRTRAFNVILNDNLNMSLDTKKQLDDAFETHWKTLGLATRNDVMELHRTLHDLQLKLNRFHKDFKELNENKNRK